MRGPWQDRQERAGRAVNASDGDPAPGVLATLQAGYDELNARPYLIAVPLALDLALWLGPRLISPAFFGWLAHWPAAETSGQSLANALTERGQTAEVMDGAAQFWGFVGVPSVTGSLGRERIASVLHRPTAEVGPWYVTLLVVLALVVIGLWLRSLFVAPLAQMVRREPFALGPALRASAVATLRIAGLYAAVTAFMLLVLIPLGIVGAAFVVAGVDSLMLVVLAALVPVAWALFYGSFATDAIMLDDVGPMRAAYLSYRVIRRNAWPTAGFVTTTALISWGLPVGLSRVVAQPIGVVPVMIAHAYIVAGLATGSLLFYRERRARTDDIREQTAADSGQKSPTPSL